LFCKLFYNLQNTDYQNVIPLKLSELSNIQLFEILKKEISKRFFESNSASSTDFLEWKGQDITNFQEDLFSKTKSTVSEKWFYTYFKSDFKKLPRVDMLNILSQYAGYPGWMEFIQAYQEPKPENFVEKQEEIEKPPLKKRKKQQKAYLFILLGFLLLSVISIALYFSFFYQKTYAFCFEDADRNSIITEPIEITIERKGFAPRELLTTSGCVEFSIPEDTLLMFVKSAYYKQDTLKINLVQYREKETIRLQPDDYKVMLRHYSKSSQSVKDRIKMLDQMIADDALIYQVYDNEYFGVEVLSKKQYINLVSLPTTSLKNFTLIEAERKSGKIVKIKFKIQSDES
jgi:hypothetical protein